MHKNASRMVIDGANRHEIRINLSVERDISTTIKLSMVLESPLDFFGYLKEKVFI